MLINLRNALMAGRRLPYDAEVEYLESSGTQYIDTGVVWESVTTAKIEVTVQYTQTSGRQITCGAGTAFYFGCNANRWEWAYGRYTRTVGTGVHTVAKEISTTATNFYVDGALAATLAGSASQAWWGSSAYAFGLNNGGSFILPSTACLYSLKIWIGDALVFDGIPVRKGTVGYLYNRVSGKLFGNAGTGAFSYGSDVVQVEWLQSHGTEYIDTGYIPNHQTRWELDYQFTSIGSGLNGMFQDNPTIRFNLGQLTDGFFNISYGANNALNIASDTLRHLFVMDIPNLQWRLDSSSGAFPGAVTNTLQNSLRIFCQNSTGGRAYNLHSGRCFASRMYQSDALSQWLLSVRVGTDVTSWEGAMMDVLTRRIYRNAGTGAFGYGNDLKYPIPAS